MKKRIVIKFSGKVFAMENVKLLKDYARFLVKISKTYQPVIVAGGGKIASRNQDKFEMLDFDSYTTEQKAWIIVECILKDKRKKDHLEESIEIIKYMMKMQPELQQDKKEVLDKYGKIFTSKNIDKLTSETYKGFLLYETHILCIILNANMCSYMGCPMFLLYGLPNVFIM